MSSFPARISNAYGTGSCSGSHLHFGVGGPSTEKSADDQQSQVGDRVHENEGVDSSLIGAARSEPIELEEVSTISHGRKYDKLPILPDA